MAPNPGKRFDDYAAYLYHILIMPNVTIERDAAAQLDELPKPIKSRMVELIAAGQLARHQRGEAAPRCWPAITGCEPATTGCNSESRCRSSASSAGHRDRFYEEDER